MSDFIEMDDPEYIGTIRTEVSKQDSAAIVDFVRETPVGIESAKQGKDISQVYSDQATTPIYRMDAMTSNRENVLGRAFRGEAPNYLEKIEIIPKEVYPERSQTSAQDISYYPGAVGDFQQTEEGFRRRHGPCRYPHGSPSRNSTGRF